MNPRAIRSEKFLQALLAWMVTLSLVMVWSSGEPRPANNPTGSGSLSFAAVQATDHVATLSAAGKIHRSTEYRHGNDPDVVWWALATAKDFGRIGLAIPFCAGDAPACKEQRTLPEPRAPPVI